MSVTLELPAEAIEQIAQRAAAILAETPPSNTPEPWFDVASAAEYLACPRSRIYSLVSARRIPFVKDGSRTLFRASQLDQWLANGGGLRP